jgi:Tol biopolymer transport system component
MVSDNTPRDDREKLLSEISRRDVLKASGAATGAAMFGAGSAQAHSYEIDGEEVDVGSIDIEETDVTVSQGTNVAPTVSPDGKSIVMDLHGILFRLPRDGGHAEPLTDVELEPARPDYAPNDRLAFQAYAGGNFDIWTMAPDGSDLRQLTDDFWDDREPKWSPDGSQIAFSSDRGETYDIWTLNPATGDLQQWTDTPDENYEPTWSPDGTEIAYVSNAAGQAPDKIKAVDQDGEIRTLITAEGEDTLHSPSWSPNGEEVAYVREMAEDDAGQVDLMVSGEPVTEGEDVFIFTPDWLSSDELLYSADGDIRVLTLESGESSEIPFSATFHLPEVDYDYKSHFENPDETFPVQGIETPTLSPNGKQVAFVALNDLWVMEIGDSPHRITDDSAVQVDPAWSPDGRYLAYSSDAAGTQDLYVHDMQTGGDLQVTSRDEEAAVSAEWSPDASKIAFQNQDRATFTIEVSISEDEVETGEIRQVLDPLFLPGQPTWSADGTALALAALQQYSDRFRSGTSQILTVDLGSGKENYYPPGEKFDSISTRGDDGPVWSPNGRWMAFVVESTLRVMPVTDDGEPAGPAEQITDEATDSPSWSGDSEWLLYLNNGQLKKIKRDGSVTKDISVPLTFTPAEPADRQVIYAGRVWDGTSPDVHEDVTIEVVNNRIENITADTEPPSGSYVDASDLMVIPGLMDSHVHYTYDERFFGGRQGRINLAYGVTSTVSVGDRVYRAFEDRESLRSGNRVGPRYFAMGEPIDGSRVYYGFIGRPTRSIEQIPLEMSRAIELGYNMGKTYVRLNAKRMQLVTDINHSVVGVPTKSHYLAPGALVGQDGTTHLSATQRLGYARTQSVTNQTYEDIPKLYGQGERSAITTFFTTDFLLADEVMTDPRAQLFPPWDREELFDAVEDNTEFPSDPDCDTALCRNANTFKNIIDHGGVILTGTDAPLDYFGLGMHANLRTFVEYAVSPYQALVTATRWPAERLGVEDDLGTLEAGKLADMAFVEGNPLEDISDAIQVEMTMKNGELHTIDELVEPFEEGETDDENDTYEGPGDDDDGDDIDADGDGAVDEDDEDKDDDDDSDGNNVDDDGDGAIDEDDDRK